MPQTHFEGCKDRERMLEYKPGLKKVLFLNKLMLIWEIGCQESGRAFPLGSISQNEVRGYSTIR